MDGKILIDDDTGDIIIDEYVARYDYKSDGVYYYHTYIDGVRTVLQGRTEEELIHDMIFELYTQKDRA